jgi:hypothetical protein
MTVFFDMLPNGAFDSAKYTRAAVVEPAHPLNPHHERQLAG